MSEPTRKISAEEKKEETCLKEHEPLTELLSQIPQKVQRGIKTQPEVLELTSLDANEHFIALGSNIGTVFLYDRDKHTIQRLRSENSYDSVVSVGLHHGLDDMVAAGYVSGAIYIFQLPSMKLGHSKQLEKIVVPDLHENPVQCLTFSTNGMKLYSGDRTGSVGCTEVDFYEGKCTSTLLLIESKTEIVQLSSGHRSLLVSTKHRCLVCRMDDNNRIVQVGSKERKISGDFGACFIPAMCKPDDAQLFACRPGFRIWKASIQGTVNNTFIFKDILAGPHSELPLLPYETTNIIKSDFNQFGPVHLLNKRLLVTWNASCLYVVDPDTTELVGSQKYIGYIKSLVVTEDEIFVLRLGTDRHVIRIAFKPLPSSSSQVLRQLQEDRKDKEKERQAEEEEKDPSKDNSSTTKVKSPFKILQGNILDKVKKIPVPKPSAIKEKIQDTLKLDSKPNKQASKYDGQGYVFNDNTAPTMDESQSTTPPGALPPVIELESPELMKLKIQSEGFNDGPTEDKSLEVHSIPYHEGFSDLSAGRSLETEITLDQSMNGKKTGTGAISALARLQEDHKQDEIEEPVYRINVEMDRNTRDPFSFVSQTTVVEDDIVFSKKTKAKNKKKKKGTKDLKARTSLQTADKDPDTLSIHSVTSVQSDISDSFSYSGNHDNQTSSNTASVNQDILADTGENIATVREDISAGTEENTASVSQALSADAGESEEHIYEKQLGDIGDGYMDRTEGIRNETGFTNDIETEDDKLSNKGVNADPNKEPDKERNETDFTVSGSISDNVSEIKPAEPECSPSIGLKETNSVMHSSLTEESGPNVSNLDREISRLDSFLSGNSDLERSNSSGGSTAMGTDYAQSQFHHILLKDTLKTNSERNESSENVLMDSDKEYKPSSLEQQLNELENLPKSTEAPGTAVGPVGPPSLSSLDLQQPASIYSMYKTPSTSGEDFYSKYGLTSPDISMDTTTDPISEIVDKTQSVRSNMDNTDEEDNNDNEDTFVDNAMESSVQVSEIPSTLKSVNNWTEVNAPGNVNSLSVSHSHIWISDRSSNIYYSNIRDIGMTWKKASGFASQISVSKNGSIVWRLYKNVVYAGTKITAKHPEGMNWVEAVKDVAFICVAETCAWYIKTSFEVMIQKGLSKDRPCYTGQLVDCSHRLKQIVCQGGVVWALTDKCQWLYRDGVTAGHPEGTVWKSGDSGSEKQLFSYISLGDGNLGWAVDVVGQIWFCCDVTMATPRGNGKWLQVPLSGEYIMKDLSAYELLKSVSKKFDPIKMTMLLSTQSGGLICGRNGVWVCPEYKHTLHVCLGSIQGHLWSEAHPESMAVSSTWKTILARNASGEQGILWGQQPNGDLFCFSANRTTCNSVECPAESLFVGMSVCEEALWALTADGRVYIRTGMSPNQMQGMGWCQLDLAQLAESHLVSVSCGKVNVWAVDSDGNVFHRIGVRAPSEHNLNAAWLPVDNGGTQFTKIIAGSQDWMVWAIDNKRQVYVRKGVTLEMPIGREWVHVSGSPAMAIALSDNYVWAINHSGELLCRHGVTMDNVTGDYWKIVPGTFSFITVSPDDLLWGINKEGQLLKRYTKYVINNAQEWKTQSRRPARETSGCSEEGDWEFV